MRRTEPTLTQQFEDIDMHLACLTVKQRQLICSSYTRMEQQAMALLPTEYMWSGVYDNRLGRAPAEEELQALLVH